MCVPGIGEDGGPGWSQIPASSLVNTSLSTSSVSSSGAIYFNGEDNATYGRAVQHVIPGAAISTNDFTVVLDFECPITDQLPPGGRGLFVLSASDPSSTLNASFAGIICGTLATGIDGASKGDLIVRVQAAAGGDLVLHVAGFADDYGGRPVKLRFCREVTASDYVVRVYANASLVGTVANGSSADWGTSLGSGSVYFSYGFLSNSGVNRPFQGYISAAAVLPGSIGSEAACATFDRTFPVPLDLNHGRTISFAQLVPSADETFAAPGSHTWANLARSTDTNYSLSGGGTYTQAAGDASSWLTGRINPTAAAGKLQLTASGSAGTNRCTLSSVASQRGRYLFVFKARQASGTSAPLLVGFNLNNRENTSENLVFTPTSVEATYTGVLSALNGVAINIALQNNADAAGQVYEIDDFRVYNAGMAAYSDFSVGDGYVVRSLGTPGADSTLDTGGNHDWIPRKRFASHVIPVTADQAVTSSTTLVDSALTFRLAAGASYEFDFQGIFTLAGTASGYKFQLTAPTSPTAFIAFGYVGNGAGNSNVEIQVDTAASTLMNGSLANAATHVMHYRGVITNGTTEGNITLQIAQQVSDASALTLKRGSRLRMTRIS